MAERPKILFLAHLLPWPLNGGGQIKSYHALRTLSQDYDVILLTLIRRPDELTEEARAALEPFCHVAEPVLLKRGKVRNACDALIALITGTSFIVKRDWRLEMRDRVQKYLVGMENCSAIHVDHLQMMIYAPVTINGIDVKSTGTKIVLDNHNVEHLIPKRLSEAPNASFMTRWYAGIEWKKLRKFEAESCRRADLVLAVSGEDREMLTEMAPAALRDKIAVVPIGVDLDYWGTVQRDPAADTLLSIGTMYWPPNVDAIRWFCAEILPLIRRELPRTRLVVVGPKPTAEIQAIGASDPLVTVTGLVPDVRPYAERDGGVFIVPLRSGSGMRVKILTAMAMGLPVVSTTVGAEGIGVIDGTDIVIADSPEDFANAVVALLHDPERAERLGRAGKQLMERAYSWKATGKMLLHAYEKLHGETEGGSG